MDLLAPVVLGGTPHPTDTTAPVLCRVADTGTGAAEPLAPPAEPVPSAPAAPDGPQARALAGDGPVRAGNALIAVPLRARDTPLGVATFHRTADSTPFAEDDLTLARELAARAAVCVDNARLFTREHHLALELQRSLLPHGLPAQHAVDVAHRYLPAPGRVGGDWFDVIPLSGARVALVVGDVVGHGIHAAAAMGRLRTAVHNFSALDLPPTNCSAAWTTWPYGSTRRAARTPD